MWAADICVRIRALPSGTTGYEKLDGVHAALLQAASASRAAPDAASPTITGTIGWLAGQDVEAEPRSSAPGSGAVFVPQALAQLAGALDQVERRQGWRTATGGGMLLEKRYGRERWRSSSTISRRPEM